MTATITVTTKVRFARGRGRHKRIETGPAKPPPPMGRVPRISKLMALAIRFDGLLRSGAVADQSELARLARVTQPRMTQILNLLHLAPDLQEQLLFLPPVVAGDDPVHERMLRPVCAEVNWQRQRARWRLIETNTPPVRSPKPVYRPASSSCRFKMVASFHTSNDGRSFTA